MLKKTAFITGGATKIGASIANHLARDYNLIIHCNNSTQQGQKLIEKLNTHHSGKYELVKFDFLTKDNFDDIFLDLKSTYKNIDLLINNAALFKQDKFNSLEAMNLEQSFAINCFKPILLSKSFAKFFSKKGNNIINILDWSVAKTQTNFFSYRLSKIAMWEATKILAMDLKNNIRVNAIGPYYVLKDDVQSNKNFQDKLKQNPLNVQCTENDICQTIDFISASKNMTGQIIYLDGGKNLEDIEYI